MSYEDSGASLGDILQETIEKQAAIADEPRIKFHLIQDRTPHFAGYDGSKFPRITAIKCFRNALRTEFNHFGLKQAKDIVGSTETWEGQWFIMRKSQYMELRYLLDTEKYKGISIADWFKLSNVEIVKPEGINNIDDLSHLE